MAKKEKYTFDEKVKRLKKEIEKQTKRKADLVLGADDTDQTKHDKKVEF